MAATKKAAVKKTTAKKTAKAPRDRLPKAGAAAEYAPGTPLGEVNVPLSTGGTHNGTHKTLHPLTPTGDQIAWAEAAFYRMNLAMQAAEAGEDFDQAERGRVFSEIRRLTAVFLSAWETDWAEDAMSSGKVQIADMWTALADVFTAVGGAPVVEESGPDGAITVGT